MNFSSFRTFAEFRGQPVPLTPLSQHLPAADVGNTDEGSSGPQSVKV